MVFAGDEALAFPYLKKVPADVLGAKKRHTVGSHALKSSMGPVLDTDNDAGQSYFWPAQRSTSASRAVISAMILLRSTSISSKDRGVTYL